MYVRIRTAKSFQSDTRSNNSESLCQLQSTRCPCTLQLTKTFGSKRPALFELLLGVSLWNDFAVHLECSISLYQITYVRIWYKATKTWYKVKTTHGNPLMVNIHTYTCQHVCYMWGAVCVKNEGNLYPNLWQNM